MDPSNFRYTLHAAGARISNSINITLAFILDVFIEYKRDRGTLFAAAISFFGLISFIPLMLFAVGVFGYIIGSYERAFDTVMSFAKDFLPISSNDIDTYLRGLSSQSTLLSGLGLLGLLWAGIQVFVILQQVMNIALGIEENVGFFYGRLKAVIVVAIAGMLFIVSIVLTSFVTAASHWRILHPSIININWFWDFMGVLIPILMSILAFTVLYRYLPSKNIGTVPPFIGGITAGLLFELAKYIYQIFIVKFANYHVVYGSLGSVILLVIWTYYVSVIAILGAEVTSTYATYRSGYLKRRRNR